MTATDDPTLMDSLESSENEKALRLSAIDEEFNCLEEVKTWTADNYPASQFLPTQLVLKLKRLANGTGERFNNQIVAGGNFQNYGERYMKAHAPAVSFAVVSAFLYLATSENMIMVRSDVKSAFLNVLMVLLKRT